MFVIAHQVWIADFDLHMATVRTLMRDLGSNTDPMVGAPSEIPYFTPYTVTLAAVAATLGIAPLHMFEAAAVLNVALFLAGAWRLSRNLGDGRLLPAVALVLMLVLWGLGSPHWSGFYDLSSLSFTLPYPSLFATGLMLLAWDMFLDLRRSLRWRNVVLLALLGPLILLVHPFTALNTAVGLAAFALTDLRPWRGIRAAALVGAGVVSIAVAAAWPYFDVLSLLSSSAGLNEDHLDLIELWTRQWGFAAFGLAFVGLPALIARRSRRMGRELLILFGLSAALVMFAAVSGSYSLARVSPLVVLPLHLSLAAYLVEFARPLPRVTLAYLAIVCVAVAAGVYGQRPAIARAWPPRLGVSATTGFWDESRRARLAGIDQHIVEGTVVVADMLDAGRALNSLGAFSVAPLWDDPWLPSAEARALAVQQLLAPTTAPDVRAQIAAAYSVDCLLALESPWLLQQGALPGFSRRATSASGGELLCRDTAY